MYTKVEVYYCTHETSNVINQCYFNEKEVKKKKKYKIFSKEKQRQTNLNIWNTGTNGAHSQQDPSDEADESHHCLSPQHCGMDIDGGNCRKKPF